MAPKTKWASPLQQAVVTWLTEHPDTTRAALAEKAAVDKSMISRIVNGERASVDYETGEKLAAAMGVSQAELRAGHHRPQPAIATIASSGPAAAVPGEAGPGAVLLPFSRLRRSAFNPRKAFDRESLQNLAESIAEDGLLENLIVAPEKDGFHTIIAGERRYRAIEILVETRRADADAPLWRAIVLAGDEARVRALALIENLQREDLKPLEEGEAFEELARLDPAAFTNQSIAAKIHKTERFVQQRRALATKLTSEAKKRLGAGKISVEEARVLATAPSKLQRKLLDELDMGYYTDVDELRRAAREDWFAVAAAIFPEESYKGEIVTDDDGARFFTDGDQAAKLQVAAAKAKAEDLRKERAWVRILEQGSYFHAADYTKSRARDLSGAGAVVEIRHDFSVVIHDGLLDNKAQAGKGSAGSAGRTKKAGKGKNSQTQADTAPPFTQGLLTYARNRKTEALQDAIVRSTIADDGATAMRLAIMGGLGFDIVRLGRRDVGAADQVQGAAVGRVFRRFNTVLKDRCGKKAAADFGDDVDVEGDWLTDEGGDGDGDASGGTVSLPVSYSMSPAAVWHWLGQRPRDELVEIFAAVIADRAGTWVGHRPNDAHEPVDVAIAASVRLDMTQAWTPDEAYIAAARKPRLEVMAKGLGLTPPKRTVELRELLVKTFEARRQAGHSDPALPPAAQWFPPELLVLDEKTLAGAVQSGSAPVDAPAAALPATAMAAE